MIYPPDPSFKYQQRNLAAYHEKLGEKWRILRTKYLFHIPHGSLTCRRIFRNLADGFASPQTPEGCRPTNFYRP
jgi:hypothetical protein